MKGVFGHGVKYDVCFQFCCHLLLVKGCLNAMTEVVQPHWRASLSDFIVPLKHPYCLCEPVSGLSAKHWAPFALLKAPAHQLLVLATWGRWALSHVPSTQPTSCWRRWWWRCPCSCTSGRLSQVSQALSNGERSPLFLMNIWVQTKRYPHLFYYFLSIIFKGFFFWYYDIMTSFPLPSKHSHIPFFAHFPIYDFFNNCYIYMCTCIHIHS